MKVTDILTPKVMLVLYTNPKNENRSYYTGDNEVYLEFAPITNGIPGAFIPLSNKMASQLGHTLISMNKFQIGGFVPDNLIYCGLSGQKPVLIWYTKPQFKTLRYNLHENSNFKSAKIKLPYLVWYYFNNSLYLYAAKEKPNIDTELFIAPFGNISNGLVCLGAGIKLTERVSFDYEELMNLVETAFFVTNFTHQSEKNVIKGNLINLHKSLHTSKKDFPIDVLISTHKNIQSIIYKIK